ncbi:MAG: CAP domain-containing protein [Chloroflexota bacterium]
MKPISAKLLLLSSILYVFLILVFIFDSQSQLTLAQSSTPAAYAYLPAIFKPLLPTETPVPTATTEPTATALPTETPPPTETPLPTATATAAPPGADWLAQVNNYRAIAGVPLVSEDATLNDNCFQHARYMAENNDLTHSQNSGLPYASAAGEMCAGNGNVWLGSTFHQPIWTVADSIDGWMSSVGHRLWLLYPTTPTFGYGFYTADNNRAGAALDVLSRTTFDDASYGGWPIQYPAAGQTAVPATNYTITLNWPYFGPTPTLTSTSLTTTDGTSIPHTADTSLPVGHEGVQIKPNGDLPANTTVRVTISGNYDGVDFSESWEFTTGN